MNDFSMHGFQPRSVRTAGRGAVTMALIMLASLLFISLAARAEFPGLSITPNMDCQFIGPVGGPFSPDSCDYSLVNSINTDITVSAMVSVLFEPPWLEGLINNSSQPLNNLQPTELIVPANSSLSFRLRLTDDVALVTNPDNIDIFGGVEFSDPENPSRVVSTAGILVFTEGNDDFASAQLIDTVIGSVSESTVGATKEVGEPDHAGNAGGASLWYRYLAPAGAAGTVTLTTDFSDIDTLLAVYTGTSVDNLTLIAANDNATAGSTISELTFTVTPGETYFIALDGVDGATGFFQLGISENLLITNDNFADATEISGLAGNTTQFAGFSASSTREPNEPTHGGGFGNSVWLRWTAPAGGVYRFTAGEPQPGAFPTTAVYLGTAVDELVEVASTAIIAATNQVDFMASAGAEYSIALADTGQSGSYSVAWELLNPQPASGLFASILPATRAVQLGQTATVFANIFNSSAETALNCRPEGPNQLLQFTPTGFDYQTTNAENLLISTPNTPADVAPGAVQNYLLQMTSPAVITGGRLGVRFVCDNLIAAPVFADVNAWTLRVLSFEPADVIAVGVSAGDPGVVDVPPNGAAAFAAAGINLGPATSIEVRPQATFSSTLVLNVCETDAGGACLADPTPTLSIPSFGQNELRTFSVFLSAGAEPIAFDPAFKRIFLNFNLGVTTVGATSLAIRSLAD